MNSKPYTHSELMECALGKPLDPLRMLATFAAKENWLQVYQGKTVRSDYQFHECEWAFIGPFRPPYEMAQLALEVHNLEKACRR